MVLEYFYQDPFLYRKMLMGGKKGGRQRWFCCIIGTKKMYFYKLEYLETDFLSFLSFFFMKRKNIMKFESKYS